MSDLKASLEAHEARASRARRNIQRFRRLVAHNQLVLRLEKRRAARVRERLSRDGERGRAVHWALNAVGVVERPAMSNRGPRISEWQRLCGYKPGVPWCQCYATNSLLFGSHNTIDAANIGGSTVSVVDRARRGSVMGGRGGWRVVGLDAAKPGDWVFFDFNAGGESVEHVGVYLSHDASTVTCCEGNTSSGDRGSQSNGGGVFVRTRPRGVVAAVVAVPFKD